VRRSHLLFAAIPAALAAELLHASPLIVFAVGALALIPAANLMTQATEQIAEQAGPGVGGILNVSFGNGPELILILTSLAKGLDEVVKASLVGSVLGNVLLVLGAAMLVGGRGRELQSFDRTVVQAYSGMMLLATGTVLLPTLLASVGGQGLPQVGATRHDYSADVELLSAIIAVILLATYVAAGRFALGTHRHIFNPGGSEPGGNREGGGMTAPLVRLAVAGVLVGVTSDLIVGSVTETAKLLGVSAFFLAAIPMAIAGNAAEHWVAIRAGMRDDMHLAMTIALGSASQIALVVAPVVVLASFVIGPTPLALVFNPFEIAAAVLAVVVSVHLTSEGQSNWFEGVQLLATYAAVAALFLLA
jgi:Ca2+:H+ antiporter